MKRSKIKKINIERKNVVVGSGTDDDNVKEYVCNSCRFIIHTRATEGKITCLHCGDIIIIEGTRKRSKLETPHKNIEPAITSVPFPNYKDVAIKHEPTPQGAFKMLQDKGLRIKNYREEKPT
jgi:predicted RNA-binding Zn-ribbon protein involved in translation (DUF1610 family)